MATAETPHHIWLGTVTEKQRSAASDNLASTTIVGPQNEGKTLLSKPEERADSLEESGI